MYWQWHGRHTLALESLKTTADHDAFLPAGEESQAAIRLGASAKGAKGIHSSFSSSHLLGGGHIIDLHAFKYRIDTETEVGVGTELPPWAVELGIDETQLTWLN